MIEIIKYPEVYGMMEFNCDHCGAIWRASEKELLYHPDGEFSFYSCHCPFCGMIDYAKANLMYTYINKE